MYVEQWLAISKLICPNKLVSEKRRSPSFSTHWAHSHGHQTALNVCVWLRRLPQSRSHWIVNITAFCVQPSSFSHSLLYIFPFLLSLEWSGFTSHSMKASEQHYLVTAEREMRKESHPSTYWQHKLTYRNKVSDVYTHLYGVRGELCEWHSRQAHATHGVCTENVQSCKIYQSYICMHDVCLRELNK